MKIANLHDKLDDELNDEPDDEPDDELDDKPDEPNDVPDEPDDVRDDMPDDKRCRMLSICIFQFSILSFQSDLCEEGRRLFSNPQAQGCWT